jgi:hypothetical protein
MRAVTSPRRSCFSGGPQNGLALEAFFATTHYAAARPAEVLMVLSTRLHAARVVSASFSRVPLRSRASVDRTAPIRGEMTWTP